MDPNSFFNNNKHLNKLVSSNDNYGLNSLLSNAKYGLQNMELLLAQAIQHKSWDVATTLMKYGAKVKSESIVHAICEGKLKEAEFFIEQSHHDIDKNSIENGIQELCPTEMTVFKELVAELMPLAQD